MANVSTYLGNKIGDGTLRNVAYTPAATVYVALYTTNPTAGDTGTEVTGGSYARTAITFSAFSAAASSNSGAVTFPTATANWGTVSHWGIRDASSAGNLLYYGPFTSSQTVNSGSTFKIQAGGMTCSIS